jgi:dTDP-glucose 4,6-dehydratase
MRIIVTGGLGFIGSNFITWMLDKESDVVILNIDRGDYCSDANNVARHDRYSYVKGDVTDEFHMKTIFEFFKPDVVIHYAAQSHVDNSFSTPIQFTKDNVIGTHVLVQVAKDYGLLQKFIHMSTDEVYGEVNNDEISDEKSILNPTNPYSASKAGAEHIVRSYGFSFNFPYIIVRSNNVYGPKQYCEKLVPLFINNLIQGKKCEIHGVGSSRRNFVYVDDVSEAMRIILNKGKLGSTYNIGTNNEFNVSDIFNILRDLIDPGATHVNVPDRPFNDSRYCINSQKLRDLGWSDVFPFHEGILRTIEWYKSKTRVFHE